MGIGSISAIISGLKGAIDITSTAVTARDDKKIATALQDANYRVIELKQACLELLEKQLAAAKQIQSLEDENRQLRAEAAALSEQANERHKYGLHQLSDGVFVYAYQRVDDDPVPLHYLCQPCMDNAAKKAVLKRMESGYTVVLECPVCKNQHYTGEDLPITL